jgi:hypothetical protein
VHFSGFERPLNEYLIVRFSFLFAQLLTNKWKKNFSLFWKEEEEEKWLFDTRDVGRLCMLISLSLCVSSLWRGEMAARE